MTPTTPRRAPPADAGAASAAGLPLELLYTGPSAPPPQALGFTARSPARNARTSCAVSRVALRTTHLATAAVREICGRAAAEYGLTALRAVTTLDNAGSRAVPARTGFVPTGEIQLGGRPGLRLVRNLREAPEPGRAG
ncbi:GNAT family N-acetyltransferase [Streptomyces sp. NPDC005498]|uniref:GNAT family N-acetyltransferase n=1 Tax=Streptomyces sp. NPDC005498 TaxID=3364717 RepID=UPI0036C7E581